MKSKQFKSIRASLGLTHVALAKMLGRSIRSVSAYENGPRVIPEPVAIAMKSFEAKRNKQNDQITN